MGLKALLDSLDDVQDELKDHYKQDGDRFVLDIDGIDDHPKVRGVITANKANKDKRDQLKSELDGLKARLDGLPEDFDASVYQELRQAAEGKGGTPTEEQLEEARAKIRKKLETDFGKERAGLEDRLSKLNGTLHRMTIDRGLADAMDQAQIDPRHKAKLLPYFKTAAKIVVEESDDGFSAKFDTDMGQVSLGDYVREWATSDDGKIYVAKPTGPSPKGGAGGHGGNKTITRSQFDAMGHAERSQAAKDGFKVVDG